MLLQSTNNTNTNSNKCCSFYTNSQIYLISHNYKILTASFVVIRETAGINFKLHEFECDVVGMSAHYYNADTYDLNVNTGFIANKCLNYP